MDSASGLVGTVLTLASGVKAPNQKVNEMDAECQPTSAEVTFVNEIRERVGQNRRSQCRRCSAFVASQTMQCVQWNRRISRGGRTRSSDGKMKRIYVLILLGDG